MQFHKHELTIYRGEAFTISKILQNRNGTPYIISNELINPYFLLSISDTLYEQSGRYVKNYWLPITTPTFDMTTPVHIKDVSSYLKLDDVTSFPITGNINGEIVSISERFAVFYDDEGVYKYWDNGWKIYNCRVIKSISTEDSRTLVAQNYYYSIQLVSGELGEVGLSNIQNSVPILQPTKIKVNNYAQGGVL